MGTCVLTLCGLGGAVKPALPDLAEFAECVPRMLSAGALLDLSGAAAALLTWGLEVRRSKEVVVMDKCILAAESCL